MKKIVNLYMERFVKITKKDDIENYRDIKNEILKKCESNNDYMSIDYLKLEIERINLKLEQEQSQYISIIYTIIIFILPIFITTVLKLLGIELEKIIYSDFKNIFIYLFIPLMLIIIMFINKMRTYKCYYIYKTVIEKLILDLDDLQNSKLKEVAITEGNRT